MFRKLLSIVLLLFVSVALHAQQRIPRSSSASSATAPAHFFQARPSPPLMWRRIPRSISSLTGADNTARLRCGSATTSSPSGSTAFERATDSASARSVSMAEPSRARRASRSSAGRVYTLASSGPGADFHYYELSAEEYLLVPRKCLPAVPVMFVDTEASTYQRFKNTVAALATSASL